MQGVEAVQLTRSVDDSYDFVITADESCMHNYNMSFMAGFLACVPRDLLPNRVQKFVESKFFSEVPNKNGAAELSILALRKMEAYLSDLGYRVIVATPQSAAKLRGKAFLVSTMDPLGFGPATTTMVGLTGGKEPYNRFFFKRLIGDIKANNPTSLVVAGGPGIWEMDIDTEQQDKLGIDLVVFGPAEALERQFWDDLLQKKIAEKKIQTSSDRMRPDPHMIKGPSFWGMVEISRGCGRGCQFCDLELMSGFKWIPKDFILKEVAINSASPYVNNVTLLSEDILRYGTQAGDWKINHHIVDLVKEISKFGKRIAMTHCTFASALSNPKVTEDFSYYCGLDEKHLSGFQTGIETGSPKIMKRYMVGKLKPWKPDDWPEVVEQGMGVMVDNYIIPHCTIVMGLPEETADDTTKTLELVDRVRTYPSLILPLFFVPLSVLKGGFFIDKMMTPEQKALMSACSKHTAYWSKRLPNWSGQLGLLDRLVFQMGADYSFTYLNNLIAGKGYGTAGVMINAVKAMLKASAEIAIGTGKRMDYWEKTRRDYSVLQKLDPEYLEDLEVPRLGNIGKPPGSGCGCGIGGVANLEAENFGKGNS
ncbi:MAG: B12-binding domain-containing radical SAM protein [Candidatus Micrarchaeota archaeon]|nr:B12-binding domain-containing radical SAM protein [Candidatus Micrarchaeota archaeon]